MEDNIVILEEDGKDIKYRILLDIEDLNKKNYLVYTKDNKSAFISRYTLTKTGKYKLYNVNDKEYELVSEVLKSMERGNNEVK